MKASLVALSNYCFLPEIETAMSNISKIGFDDVEPLCSMKNYFGRWAGTPKERLESFYEAWNSDSDAIFACKGGTGVEHFVKDIDVNMLSSKKLFVGYSNLTPILNLLNVELGVISLYGPMGLKTLDRESVSALRSALQMKDYSMKFYKKDILVDSEDVISGVCVAGNLRSLVKAVAMGIKIDFRDKIFFVEDVDSEEVNDYMVYNFLSILKKSEFFSPKAIMVGSINSSNGPEIKKMLKNLFPKTPLIYSLPFGHKLPNITIPIGANCVVDFKELRVDFSFPESEKSYAIKLNSPK